MRRGAQQRGDSIVFDESLGSECCDRNDAPDIPSCDGPGNAGAVYLLVQNDHVAGWSTAEDLTRASFANRMASLTAAAERRLSAYSRVTFSMLHPAASKSRTKATSRRVYLKVGRPPHTPGAATTYLPSG